MSSSLQQPAPAGLQVVFQGGGAKLVCLMAVADVLQQYERIGKIEIKRAAGSSAGAIAAVMLASRRDMELYKADLLRIGPSQLAAMRTSLLIGIWRILWGRPYFGDFDLRNVFQQLICPSAASAKFLKDLRLADTKVYYTDLFSLSSHASASDQAIAAALAESCNFPFAFVGFGAGNTRVDGGLALNLPVDELRDQSSTKGSIIAIGFENRFGSPGKHNLISFVQQLFSAAIQSSVYRSEAILGREHVHRIDTTIGTFDFDVAMKDGLSNEYDRVSLKFAAWLDEWLKKHGPVNATHGSSRKLLRPTLTDPWAPAVVNELNDRIKAQPSTNAVSVQNFETALLDEKSHFTGRYLCRAIKTFEIVRPTNSIQFSFQVGRAGTFDSANLGCLGYDSRGNPLEFSIHVQELTEPDDSLRSFRVYFLFNKALLPGDLHQPYSVEYQYEGSDPYPNLGKGPEAVTLALRQGGGASAVVAIAFPRSKLSPGTKVTDIESASDQTLNNANYERDDVRFVGSKEMQLHAFIDQMNLSHPVEQYWLVGRHVLNVSQETAFGFVIE